MTMRNVEWRYALEREIGRGATGSVWTALDGQLGRRVAVKLLRADCLEHPAARARFEHEAWTVAQFRSRHIVQVHDAGVYEGQPFIVMELLDGESLEARLQRHPRLPLPIVAGIVVQIARALDLSHQAGIIHRDLKPANVFLAREHGREVVKLLDFGIATLMAGGADPNGPVSSTRSPLEGTPQYMSPGLLMGAEAGTHGDLWALGVLTYQMLTGRCPFEADQLWSLRGQICSSSFDPPSSRVSSLGHAVDAFFRRAFAKDSSERFQRATELSAALLQLAGGAKKAVTRVLFIDDEPDMELLLRQRFRRELREGRYELHFAMGGQQGLEMVRRRPDIDVVLTDINMPGMDGLTFLERVPEINPLVKVVVVSAYSDMTNIRLAMNRGAFDFLVKPIDFEDLQRTIEKCAAHVAELREAMSSQEENGILRLLVGQGMADRLVTSVKASGGLQQETFEASVAFVDVHGLSANMASHAPHEVFRHLNAQFDTFVPELLAREGTVCRFIGDSVMTIFEGSDHLSRALDACLAVRDRVRLLDQELADGRGQYGAAIGIDTGIVFSGGVGSRTIGRLEHTVLGEAVSTAARLQSLAGKDDILVLATLQPHIPKDFICESDGGRQLATSAGVVPVFQIVGKNSSARRI